MSSSNEIHVTPWPNPESQSDGPPAGGKFVCAYSLHLGADEVDEAAVFIRGATKDELWVVSRVGPRTLDELEKGHYTAIVDPQPSSAPQSVELLIERDDILTWGLAVWTNPTGSVVDASQKLLDTLFRSRLGHGWPTRFVRGGLIGHEGFDGLIDRLKSELEANAAAAREKRSEIVAAAETLGLEPSPTGTGPNFWQARCPSGRPHYVYINAENNQFGCGYCERKGGPDELAEFVAERQRKAG